MEPFNPACTNESARTEDPPCGLTQHVCLAAAGSALECCEAKYLVPNKRYNNATNAGGKATALIVPHSYWKYEMS